MIIILPKWYDEVEEKLRQEVIDLANKLNLNFAWVLDSKTIHNSIENICRAFVTISEKAKPEHTQKQLREFKKLEELIAKEEGARIDDKIKIIDKKVRK